MTDWAQCPHCGSELSVNYSEIAYRHVPVRELWVNEHNQYYAGVDHDYGETYDYGDDANDTPELSCRNGHQFVLSWYGNYDNGPPGQGFNPVTDEGFED